MAWGPKKLKQRGKKVAQRSKTNAKSKKSKQSRPKKAVKGRTVTVLPPLNAGKKFSKETNDAITEAADEINGEYRGTTQGLLRLGHRCARAEKEFKKAAKEELLARLLFNKTNFSMFVRIGNDSRLASISELLPPSYSIIYEVAKLDDDKLDAAVKDGVIHPKATRKEIQDLRNGPIDAESDQEGDEDDQEDEKSEEESDNLSERWDKYVKPHFDKASKKARDRFVKMVLAANKRIGKKNS
jgi:hypothetical protein